MITLSIDVTKIDKSRLFVGKKGTYLDCVLIETPNSEYGDYMVVESVTKEEREQGKKGTILGNGKIVGQTTRETDTPVSETTVSETNDLPF